MIKIQKQVCECCGGSSFKNIGENRIQCEYCDTVYFTDKDASDRFRNDAERVDKECEELLNSHHSIITLLNQYEDNCLEEKYNRCIEIEVKRKKLNRLFIILMIVSFILSAITGGAYATFSVVFLFCIVWNDSRQKTRNAQAFIKEYLSKRV